MYVKKNNNVLIKEVTVGLTQPEWEQRGVVLVFFTPKRDSRAVMLGSSTCPATDSPLTWHKQEFRLDIL